MEEKIESGFQTMTREGKSTRESEVGAIDLRPTRKTIELEVEFPPRGARN